MLAELSLEDQADQTGEYQAGEVEELNQSQALVAVGGGRSGGGSSYPPVEERQYRGCHSRKMSFAM